MAQEVSLLLQSVSMRLSFFLTVFCLCACMLYAQALSTPCPSILQGFQSRRGKRPATTMASSGSSACNFCCSNDSWNDKSTIVKHYFYKYIVCYTNIQNAYNYVSATWLHAVKSGCSGLQFTKDTWTPFRFFDSQNVTLLTTLGAKNTVTFLHSLKSTCEEINGM